MNQRHRKAYVVRRQDMDRLIRLIAAKSIARTVELLSDRMMNKVYQRDAEFRAQILRWQTEAMGASFAKSLEQFSEALRAMGHAAAEFPKTYLQQPSKGA
jgi:hypothetical protein